MTIICETNRLLLRELVPTDAAGLFEIYSDDEVMRFMGSPPESDNEEHKGILNHIETHYRRLGYGLWGVIEKESGVLIGRSGLLPIEIEGQPRVEISYLIARDFWGHGFATEAAMEIVRYAFDELDLVQLYAAIHPDNQPSARVADRVGFRILGKITYKLFGVVDLYEHSCERNS